MLLDLECPHQNTWTGFDFPQVFKTPRHLCSLKVHELLSKGQIPWSFLSLQ